MLSRLLGFALLATTVTAIAVWPVHTAAAQSDDDEDEGDDEADDDDDDGGGAEEEEEEEEQEDSTQPPITAGGLFTLKTYPIRELERPLTITEKILQVRGGLGVDISDKGAFDSVGVNLEARYGFRDHVMGLAGLTSTYNFHGVNLYAGIEAALAYDLIDFRATARLGKVGTPVLTPDGMDVAGYDSTKFQFSIDIGFPFRYAATKEIAIIALDTLMSIDFNEVDDPSTPDTKDNFTPDLNPSLGIATNPIAPVSIVLFAQLNVIDFDTSESDNFRIPATARVQFSPSQKLDLGLEFSFLNMNASGTLPNGDEKKFYHDRFLLLYGQLRVGR